MPVTLFYLVLRGLDTIEDDLTIDLKEKEPLLRNFHKTMVTDGWTYDGNGPNEKDRELLVHFDVVVEELKKVKPEYFEVIEDITIKMGNGMADYALNAEFNNNGVATIKDYEKYCHYVAGLVGEGCTRLFHKSGLAHEKLMERPNLTESMGQFLQKTNIIRDIREDFDDGRKWWPKEIWSQYFDTFPEMFEPQNRTKAVHCLNHMVLNALKHVEECLFYMAAIRDQSVFNFVAIPQSMAIATLELVFNNQGRCVPAHEPVHPEPAPRHADLQAVREEDPPEERPAGSELSQDQSSVWADRAVRRDAVPRAVTRAGGQGAAEQGHDGEPGHGRLGRVHAYACCHRGSAVHGRADGE